MSQLRAHFVGAPDPKRPLLCRRPLQDRSPVFGSRVPPGLAVATTPNCARHTYTKAIDLTTVVAFRRAWVV